MTTTPTVEALYTAARELSTLYPRLTQLVHEHSTVLHDPDSPKRRAISYPAPWNTQAGELAHDIHTRVRRYETALNIRLFSKATYRGTSDALTIQGFNRLAVLIDHAHTTHIDSTDVTDAERLLLTWPRQIRLMLDEPRPGEEPWTKAPGNLCCPHCERRLELQPGWQHNPEAADVICRHCTDENGAWMRWKPDTWLLVLQQAV